MTGKRSVKTNLTIKNEFKDAINSATDVADMFNKKTVNFATAAEGPSTQELTECLKNIDKDDDDMFA